MNAPKVKSNRIDRLEHKIDALLSAIADSNGMGMLRLMMDHAMVPSHYRYIFQKMKSGDVCIDCGMNVGIATDMMRFMDATVYGFEPHPDLYAFLRHKYQHDEKITLHNSAVWDKNDSLDFQMAANENESLLTYSAGSSLFNNVADDRKSTCVNVSVIDLCEFIETKLLEKHDYIYLLKIDIEGAEFELLDKLIMSGLHRKIKYIVCETHERYFTNGSEKNEQLHSLIRAHDVKNVYLDWI